MWAVIGGSGFEKFEGFEVLESLATDTPFGPASSGLKRVRLGGREALFISRHGEHHELLPSEINFRANIFALKKYGASAIVSFSAVGSLRAELEPGQLVIPLQYIDRTKGVRKHSFCGDGVVGHMSLAYPVCGSLARQVEALAKGAGVPTHLGQTYVCIEGPNFSTFAESQSYRELPADIIGMTACPEYSLAREAGLTYLPCCFVTDYDCWDTTKDHVTLEEILILMRQNNGKAFTLLKQIFAQDPEKLLKECGCAEQGLRSGLMTPRAALPAKHLAWLDVLLK